MFLGIKPPLLKDEMGRLLGSWSLTEAAKVALGRDHSAIVDIPKSAIEGVDIWDIADNVPPYQGRLFVSPEMGRISDPNGSVFEQVEGYEV